MGPSLCSPSFIRIRELLPPKFHHPEILHLPPLLTQISFTFLQNGPKLALIDTYTGINIDRLKISLYTFFKPLIISKIQVYRSTLFTIFK